MATASARAEVLQTNAEVLHAWPKALHRAVGCNCAQHGGDCMCRSCDRWRSRTTLWRCTRCGTWSHAQRRPSSHVRYLDGDAEEAFEVPEEMVVESVEGGMERDTGALLYSLKLRCGPFERWVAERVE